MKTLPRIIYLPPDQWLENFGGNAYYPFRGIIQRSAGDLGFSLCESRLKQELELVTSAILMSASTDQPERIAEILREIITLSGREGADGPNTELANAIENTHRTEKLALEVRNQKSGLEIIPSIQHSPDRFPARASPRNSTLTESAIASRNATLRKMTGSLGLTQSVPALDLR